MLLTQQLVQGVDLWINTPRRPWEACGTSGMKVLVNGGLKAQAIRSAKSGFQSRSWFQQRQGGANGQPDFHNGGGQFSDFFESMFGGQHSARAGANFSMAGEDVNATIHLTLEEAHNGVIRTIQFGAEGGPTKSLEVTIPAGVRKGSAIRLAGQGEPGTGGSATGDLYLHVALDPHSLFQLLGDDIQVDLPVTPWEALLGAKVNVPTLDKPVEMKIPAGSQAGQRLRLRRQGVNKCSGGRGDEYVKLRIVVPPSPTAREKELFENWQPNRDSIQETSRTERSDHHALRLSSSLNSLRKRDR